MSDKRIERLAAALTFLADRARRPTEMVMLQKLVYLADVQALRERGETITQLEYIAYDHGPWLSEFYQAAALAKDLRERPRFWSLDRSKASYQLLNGARPDYSTLTEDDRRILTGVVEQWARRPLRQVLDHIYTSPPYAGTALGEAVDLSKVAARDGAVQS